jgi:hypothetical protein
MKCGSVVWFSLGEREFLFFLFLPPKVTKKNLGGKEYDDGFVFFVSSSSRATNISSSSSSIRNNSEAKTNREE